MPSPVERIVRKIVSSARGFVGSFGISENALRDELQQYEKIIAPHFTYFNQLSPEEKERFLYRIFRYKRKKIFHYQGVQPHSSIPVLISACAVQITFGLSKYRMPYFRHIYVLGGEYTYGLNTQPWIGHVNRQGIHLSWKHFMDGYSVYGDRCNVGLHEMAHALVYVNFLGFGGDRIFAERFMQYKQKAEYYIPTLRNPGRRLFTEQASHNYHECWAESVELFFENPVEFRLHYPDLYTQLKIMLNQDPANKITKCIEENTNS